MPIIKLAWRGEVHMNYKQHLHALHLLSVSRPYASTVGKHEMKSQRQAPPPPPPLAPA